MSVRVFSLALLTSWTAGCAVGPRYTPPRVTMPAAYQESATAPAANVAERTALETWWTSFHDPMLDELVARAIEGNVDLKIADARVREARAARGIAASAAFPQVDASGAYVRGGRSNAVPPFKSASAAASAFGPR